MRCFDAPRTRPLALLIALICAPLLACDPPKGANRAPRREPQPPAPIEVPTAAEPIDEPRTPGLTPIDEPLAAAGDGCAHPDDLLPIGSAPVRGAPGAPVTLVVFASFTERASAWLNSQALPELLDAHPGQLRIVFKHAPQSLAGDAGTAARAAWAASQQGRFWQLHDALYEAGDDLRLDALGLAERASAAGLDVQRFERDLEAAGAHEAVAADLELARRLGVTAIPTVFVNGEELEGNLDLDSLALAVEQRLAVCQD